MLVRYDRLVRPLSDHIHSQQNINCRQPAHGSIEWQRVCAYSLLASFDLGWLFDDKGVWVRITEFHGID